MSEGSVTATNRKHEEAFQVVVTEKRLARAIAVALLTINDHNARCLRTSCPVGAELREVGRKAAPRLLDELLGIRP